MFVGYLRQDGLKITSIYHYGRALELLDDFMDGKPFDEVTKQDLKLFFSNLGERYDSGTIDNIKTYVKRFYKWLLGDDEEYPELVKWIKKSNHRRNKIERSDLITDEEFQEMLKRCDRIRDRALIWILWETGIRVGELISIRIRDVEIRNNMAVITVRGKTGSRTVPVVAGLPDLQTWLGHHPLKEDPDAPLFISYKRGKFGQPLLESGVYNIVHQLAKKAGIKKKIHPHLFRHTRATQLSTRLRESVLKEMFGWSQSSRVPQVYLHLAGADVLNSYSELYGLKTEEKPEEKFKPKKCPRCGAMNAFDDAFCSKCGLILDERVAVEKREDKLEEELRDLQLRMYQLILYITSGDPKILENLGIDSIFTKEGRRKIEEAEKAELKAMERYLEDWWRSLEKRTRNRIKKEGFEKPTIIPYHKKRGAWERYR